MKNNKDKAPKNVSIEEEAKEGNLVKKKKAHKKAPQKQTRKKIPMTQKSGSKTRNIRQYRARENNATKWRKQPTI